MKIMWAYAVAELAVGVLAACLSGYADPWWAKVLLPMLACASISLGTYMAYQHGKMSR